MKLPSYRQPTCKGGRNRVGTGYDQSPRTGERKFREYRNFFQGFV